MAASGDRVLHRGFSGINGGNLRWFCPPDGWDVSKNNDLREGRDGSWSLSSDSDRLVLCPPAKKDYWRKTYYRPVLLKDDGPFLFANLKFDGDESSFMMETTFDLKHASQFDQAGLMVRFDENHWIKTGVEVVDCKPRISCVVTNVYSDWSTQPFLTHGEEGNFVKARIRVHILANGSVVVEFFEEKSKKWDFVRIAHLSKGISHSNLPLEDSKNHGVTSDITTKAPMGCIFAGVFGCCPEDQRGCEITFRDFSIKEGSTFDHNAEGNEE